MNAMIRLYDQCQKVRQQQAMGFSISKFDEKLIDYGNKFESQMMNLDVDMHLHDQLDLGWNLLGKFFTREETQLPRKITDKYWNIK